MKFFYQNKTRENIKATAAAIAFISFMLILGKYLANL